MAAGPPDQDESAEARSAGRPQGLAATAAPRVRRVYSQLGGRGGAIEGGAGGPVEGAASMMPARAAAARSGSGSLRGGAASSDGGSAAPRGTRRVVAAGPRERVYPGWRSLAQQELDLVTAAKYIDRLCALQAQYERHYPGHWWGAAALAVLVASWQEERDSFRVIVHRVRCVFGREHPRSDLLARVDSMFRS